MKFPVPWLSVIPHLLKIQAALRVMGLGSNFTVLLPRATALAWGIGRGQSALVVGAVTIMADEDFVSPVS